MRLLIDIGNTYTTLGVWTNSKLSSVITVETKNFSKALLKIKNKPINVIFLTSVVAKNILSKVKKSLTKLISAKIIEIKKRKPGKPFYCLLSQIEKGELWGNSHELL